MDDQKHIGPAANGKRDYLNLSANPRAEVYPDEADDEIELRDLFAVLKRRWLPLLGVTAITGVGLMAGFLIRPPAYERSFSIAVEPLESLTGRDSSASGLEDLVGGGGNFLLPGGAGGADYDSLITVLKSDLVLEPVTQAVQAQTQDPEFEFDDRNLTVSQTGRSKILDVSFRARDPDLVQRVIAELQAAYLNYSTDTRQMERVRRLDNLNAQVAVQRQEVASTQAALAQFQGQNQILDLKSASEALERRRSEVLMEQQSTRITLEATLAQYDSLRSQVGLQPAEAILVANLSESPVYQDLLAQYREIESEIAVESARFRADTPIIQALQDKQQQLLPLLEAEVARNLGSAVTSAGLITPQTLGYQGSIGRNLAAELVSSINQIRVLEVQYQSLSQLYEMLSAQLDNWVSLGSNFREIERNLTLSEAALQRLLAARQELKLQLEAESSPWVIVSGYDLTTPLEPESRLLQGLVLSLVASAILGLGTVFLLEMLDRSYHDPQQVGDATHLPILATVPWKQNLADWRNKAKANLVPAGEYSPMDAPVLVSPAIVESPFGLALHNLDANLRLLSADALLQVVAIASALSGEGKTTVASHFAMAAAQAGRRVLLVDCDVRQPQIGPRFGLDAPTTPHQPPMADDMIMPEIRPLFQDGILDLLQFSGQSSFFSTGLLSSARFEHLLQKYRADYDLIILDTPTALNIADTKLVSQYADGLLLVVRMGHSNRDVVNEEIRAFRTTSQVPMLGIVANGMAST